MELNKFLERFLPDYKTKRQELHIKENGKGRDSDVVDGLMIMKYFSEALQNYTDLICEKQRCICVDSVKIDCGSWDGWGDRPSFDYEDVLNAEQPKTEEL